MNETEMNQEKALKDIETIKTFLEQGQKKLIDNGFYFMLWGLLMPAATIGYFLILQNLEENKFILMWYWPLMCGIGAVISFTIGTRSSRSKPVKGFLHKINTFLWQGLLFAVFSVFVVMYTSGHPITPVLIAFIAIILGLAYWVYGSLIQVNWFKYLGLIWWIASAAISGRTWISASVIMAGTTLICSFIPGLILYRRNKSRRA